MASSNERLDILLVQRGLFPSREKAQRALMAGTVRVKDKPRAKPGDRVPQDVIIEMVEQERYVGRGGLKLEAALKAFQIDVAGRICLDIGASTGGFTDCLLQHGAARVHAVDVGHGQLDWRIREDPRVVVKEKFNARHMAPEDIGEPVDLMVADVSFISLTLILPPAFALVREAVVLIKPQFELSPERVGRGGVVRDEKAREDAVRKIQEFTSQTLEASWMGVIPSPITGTDGNQEYLAWIRK